MNINLPLNWAPRSYQQPVWDALEGGCKRALLIWHRRAGKDLTCLNWTVTQAFQRVGLYWHVFPTYKQGRKIMWEGMTKDGRDFLSHWPEETITRKRDDEMTLWLANGSMWQVVGTDDVDKLVGTNPVGVVMSEYALQDPRAWNFLRPILAENDGWALFPYTPRGRNHGYQLYLRASKLDDWFCQRITVDDTKAIPINAIEDDRASGMPEEEIQQEYWCSFDAPLVGSYYGEQMSQASKDGRIGSVPYDASRPVNTAWDLGVRDATSIWFYQQLVREIRLIDYYHATGQGVSHYAGVLKQKPYVYGRHLVPHDAKVQEWGSGKTRLETARNFGLRLDLVRKIGLNDGINACRSLLSRCYFDEEKCESGIRGLNEYRKEYDPVLEVFRDTPLHNWASHPADSFRTLAVGEKPERDKPTKLAPELAIV